MTSVGPADRCAALARFVGRFDRGEFWLAHEELEALWLIERLDGYKGLIHLAAALLHLERGNTHGARTKLRSGLALLSESPESLRSFDLPAIRRAFADLLGILDAGRVDPTTVSPPRLAPWCNLPHDPETPDERLPYRVTRYEQGYATGRDPRRRD